MSSHPYLRAYMAGLVAPSIVVFVVGVAVCARFREIPPEVERAMVFPMALNPAIWGIWNVLYIWLGRRRRLGIAWHGAILPIFLIPIGAVLARAFSIPFVNFEGAALVTPLIVAAYYLIWKYIVRFINELLQISDHSGASRGQS